MSSNNDKTVSVCLPPELLAAIVIGTDLQGLKVSQWFRILAHNEAIRCGWIQNPAAKYAARVAATAASAEA